MPKLENGCIIWAETPDPQGRNPKRRPMIVLTENDAISAGAPLVCVAISRQIPTPKPSGYVVLPWSRAGHPRTGLKAPCAAVCADPPWLSVIDRADVDLAADVTGVVPTAELQEIKRLVAAYLPENPTY